ncbi:twin-arginine translocation protein, TatB subunit [Segniliparus rotundus DSM 44985]|uniref:Sec-independent protein translocase protein TatB n=1 Tax=Segniliparus rotundus (strain ATCC BAA-972 / CDC 1076 / CIP 108378 / DSM 44985 / JCM 13578) TaxID=640132 RepID=D6Z9B4_SEGRD|nr:twin-arginine translocation protein, TatB subunit [Segniliparus rotundus DSM 44985]
MFGSIGWGEIFVLLIAGLVILGPERLPGAITWATKSLRQVRAFAQDASGQLREQLGPELSELQEPIQQLSKLRRASPSALVSKHLLDGESADSLFNPFSPKRADAPKPHAPQAPPPVPHERRSGPPVFDTDAT